MNLRNLKDFLFRFSLDLLPSIFCFLKKTSRNRWPVRLLTRSRGGKANGDKQRSGQWETSKNYEVFFHFKGFCSARIIFLVNLIGVWLIFDISWIQLHSLSLDSKLLVWKRSLGQIRKEVVKPNAEQFFSFPTNRHAAFYSIDMIQHQQPQRAIDISWSYLKKTYKTVPISSISEVTFSPFHSPSWWGQKKKKAFCHAGVGSKLFVSSMCFIWFYDSTGLQRMEWWTTLRHRIKRTMSLKQMMSMVMMMRWVAGCWEVWKLLMKAGKMYHVYSWSLVLCRFLVFCKFSSSQISYNFRWLSFF